MNKSVSEQKHLMLENNPFLTKLFYFFEVFMTLLYFAIAFFLFFGDRADELFQLTQQNKTILATVILLYACFKSYRVYKKRHIIYEQHDGEK